MPVKDIAPSSAHCSLGRAIQWTLNVALLMGSDSTLMWEILQLLLKSIRVRWIACQSKNSCAFWDNYCATVTMNAYTYQCSLLSASLPPQAINSATRATIDMTSPNYSLRSEF